MTLNHARLRVSSYCSTGTCVGVGIRDQSIVMVDTKALTSSTEDETPSIAFTDEEWNLLLVFLTFDTPASEKSVQISTEENGDVIVAKECEEGLSFLSDEWDAFRRGVVDGEFDVSTLRRIPEST